MIVYRDYLDSLHFFLINEVKTIKYKGLHYNKTEINGKTSDLMIQFDTELFLKDVLNDFELKCGEYKQITNEYRISIIQEMINEKYEVDIAEYSLKEEV